MMKEKKNIDRLFQEKFQDFEAQPSDAVWDNIALAKAKKQKRKVVPFWWKLGGAAAVVALLFTAGTLLFNQDTLDNPEIVNTQNPGQNQDIDANLDNQKPTVSNTETHSSVVENLQENNSTSQENNLEKKPLNKLITGNTNKALQNTVTVQEPKTSQRKALESTNFKKSTLNNQKENAAVVDTEVPNKVQKNANEVNPSSDIKQELNKTLPSQINSDVASQTVNQEEEQNGKSLVEEAAKIEAQKNEEAVAMVENPSSTKRWNVGAVAAPVYYGDFGGSGIDPEFKDNAKTSDINLSYGVQVSYAVNNKFKVRTGVNNVNLSYNTQGIAVSPDIAARQLKGVDYSSNARFLSISDSKSTGEQLANADGFQSGGTSVSNGELQQRIGYVEVPVEAVYTLSNKRLGVDLIGGVSTLFLNDNEITVEAGGLRSNIGSSSSANDISFTTNVGVGVNYMLTDKVKVNLEPSFKYQLNAFDESAGDFKPYYIGLYTGVSYRF